MRYKVILSYDGSPFGGWQLQPDADTVQERLEKALSTLLRTDIQVTGAGRTDSGVNAIGYTAHFDCPSGTDLDAGVLGYKLNAILPSSIRVHEVLPAGEDFHARFDARLREYTYFIHRTKDPFMDRYSCFCPYPLDLDAMNKAAATLVGTHDFSCFQKTGSDVRTPVCTVYSAGWSTYVPDHVKLMGYPAEEGGYLYFKISANRFLRNMVRAIVGTLIEVGRGKRTAESVVGLLQGGARGDAGESVPGKALFLSKVEY